MSRLILAGRTLELAYPTHNLLDLPLEFTERTIEVTKVQDFARKPLAVRYLFRRPMVRRGRVLITGIDQLTQQEKRFWREACHDRELPRHRLGLYDPKLPGELADWLGRAYGPTRRERLKMLGLASLWLDRVRLAGGFRLKLAAFPVVEDCP